MDDKKQNNSWHLEYKHIGSKLNHKLPMSPGSSKVIFTNSVHNPTPTGLILVSNSISLKFSILIITNENRYQDIIFSDFL